MYQFPTFLTHPTPISTGGVIVGPFRWRFCTSRDVQLKRVFKENNVFFDISQFLAFALNTFSCTARNKVKSDADLVFFSIWRPPRAVPINYVSLIAFCAHHRGLN
jgi:hypothetical protein